MFMFVFVLLKKSQNIVRRSICVCKIGKIMCVRNSKIHKVCKTLFFQKTKSYVSPVRESFVCARKFRTK